MQARVITALLGAGGIDAAEDLVRGGQSVARARGRLLAEATTSTLLAMCRLWAGALTDAEAESRRALMVMAGQPWADPIPALTLLSEALLAQGRLPEAVDIQAGADGHPARQGLVGAPPRSGSAEPRPRADPSGPRCPGAGRRGGRPLRHRQSGADIVAGGDRSGPGVARHGRPGPELVAANLDMARAFGSLRPLGLALRAAGLVAEPGRREDLLAQSVAVLERSPARYDLARSLVDLGGALRRNGDPGQARDVLRRGAHVASVCRAVDVVAVARRELRAAGGRPRRLTVTGIDALTPAESRVAHMASTGQTNAAIAKELGVTAKTIERHLARAYQKLQIQARSELGPALSAGRPDSRRMPRATAGAAAARSLSASC